MAGRRTRPNSRGSHYDERVIGKRIEDRRVELGLETKAVYEELGWDKGEYSRKTKGTTPIWMAEYSALHKLLKGWPGFPFVDKTEGVVLEALRDRLPEVLQFLASSPAKRGG